MVIVAWPLLAFGGVYPWAYTPLLIGAALWSVVNVWRSRRSPDRRLGPIAAAMAAVGVAIGLQLIPLPAGALAATSPAAPDWLFEFDVPYAVLTAQGHQVWHPLSLNPSATARALGFYTVLAVFLYAVAVSLPRYDTRALLRWTVTLAAVIGVVAIIQQRTFNGKIYWFWVPEATTGNVFGPFVNRNHFAGWMVMALSAGLGLAGAEFRESMAGRRRDLRTRLMWLTSPRGSRVLLTGYGLLVMAVALVWPMSRSGIISFVIAVALTSIWVGRSVQSRLTRVLTYAVLVALVAIPIYWRGVDRVSDWFADTRSLSGRVAAAGYAMAAASDFALTGSGINTFRSLMFKYQRNNTEEHLAEAHNDYLQLAAEGGVLVGVPILVLIALFVRAAASRIREVAGDVRHYWLKVGASTGMLAIAVQSLVEFSLQKPANAVLFCVLAGIVLQRPASRASVSAT